MTRVTAIQPCPEIAGSVITARFLTREVQTIARVEILAGDGSSEWLEGTTIHPIWSEDRQDWVPLGELVVGEQLRAASGLATVLAIHLVHQPTPDYNLEVHSQHAYQVGNLALLAHNAYPGAPRKGPLWTATKNQSGTENALGHFKKHGAEFPEFPNATQYEQGAMSFVNNPPQGTLTKVRPNVDKLLYDPATNTFAVQRSDGAHRTMFRPTDGINYWNMQ